MSFPSFPYYHSNGTLLMPDTEENRIEALRIQDRYDEVMKIWDAHDVACARISRWAFATVARSGMQASYGR